MAASLKVKRTPITTPPYQVPSVDITPDPPIFSLVTTFNIYQILVEIINFLFLKRNPNYSTVVIKHLNMGQLGEV